MEFSRPEYWSGWPFLSPVDLPNPGIEPRSPTFQVDSLPAELLYNIYIYIDIDIDIHIYIHFIYADQGFPGGSDSKESTCDVGDMGLIPGLGGSPGEENGNQLWYSCLENPWTEKPGGLQTQGLQRVGHD